jgi:hypothetical protein
MFFEHGGHGGRREKEKGIWDRFEGCGKNFAGRRCDQKTLPQRFLAQPDGLHAVWRVLRSQHSFS